MLCVFKYVFPEYSFHCIPYNGQIGFRYVVLKYIPLLFVPLLYFWLRYEKLNMQAICSMINDICISTWGHQGRIISKGKNMMRTAKKRNKNDKIPRDRDWTLTTDRNMVRSDALPTELRGTCQQYQLNF